MRSILRMLPDERPPNECEGAIPQLIEKGSGCFDASDGI